MLYLGSKQYVWLLWMKMLPVVQAGVTQHTWRWAANKPCIDSARLRGACRWWLSPFLRNLHVGRALFLLIQITSGIVVRLWSYRLLLEMGSKAIWISCLIEAALTWFIVYSASSSYRSRCFQLSNVCTYLYRISLTLRWCRDLLFISSTKVWPQSMVHVMMAIMIIIIICTTVQLRGSD